MVLFSKTFNKVNFAFFRHLLILWPLKLRIVYFLVYLIKLFSVFFRGCCYYFWLESLMQYLQSITHNIILLSQCSKTCKNLIVDAFCEQYSIEGIVFGSQVFFTVLDVYRVSILNTALVLSTHLIILVLSMSLLFWSDFYVQSRSFMIFFNGRAWTWDKMAIYLRRQSVNSLNFAARLEFCFSGGLCLGHQLSKWTFAV